MWQKTAVQYRLFLCAKKSFFVVAAREVADRLYFSASESGGAVSFVVSLPGRCGQDYSRSSLEDG